MNWIGGTLLAFVAAGFVGSLVVYLWQQWYFTTKDPDRLHTEEHRARMTELRHQLGDNQSGTEDVLNVDVGGTTVDRPALIDASGESDL